MDQPALPVVFEDDQQAATDHQNNVGFTEEPFNMQRLKLKIPVRRAAL